MRARLWRVVEGPEWAAAVEEADPYDGYFRDNIEAVKDAVGLDPLKYSTPFLDDRDDARVMATRDAAAGYRVFVYLRVFETRRTVELGWIILEDLVDE